MAFDFKVATAGARARPPARALSCVVTHAIEDPGFS